MSSGLASKVVLVTGGARNIGRAITEAFARESCLVVFTDLGDSDGPSLEAALRRAGRQADFRQSDAADENQVRALIDGIVETHGRLDIAVNNVGGVHPLEGKLQPLHEVSLDGWQATLDLSLTSAFLGMKHQIRVMLAQGGGVIANTGSLAGLRVSPNSSHAYAAAKAAIAHLSRKAAVTYGSHNIRVNVVAPGVVAPDPAAPDGGEPRRKAAETLHPTTRWVTPEEIAAAFVWICSDQAKSLTGHVLPVDGGWAAR